MRISALLSFCGILMLPGLSKAQWSPQDIHFFPSSLSFDTTYTDQTDSLDLKVYSSCDLTADSLHFPDPAFSGKWISRLTSNDTLLLRIYFHPSQNIFYRSTLAFDLTPNGQTTIRGTYGLPLTGIGWFREAYYDSTYNLWDEDLKTVLKSITGTNYKSLGYDKARDSMFMVLDNRRITGLGAADSNRLECAYTGRIISYTDRQDAQTNGNFNTEHTYPQSMFGSKEPAKSDLHHLYPVDETANTIHSNDPYGPITNPKWEVGGSKSDYTHFEPRDQQKGRTARSLLYFVIRYGNQGGYFTSQEDDLKNWNATFLPDSIEIKRTETIYKWQRNYNPFVHHPLLADRIYRFAVSQNRPKSTRLWTSGNEITVDSAWCTLGMSYQTTLLLHNPGRDSITLSGFSNGQYSRFIDSVNVLAPGQSAALRLQLTHPDSVVSGGSSSVIDPVQMQSAGTTFSWQIIYKPSSGPTGITQRADDAWLVFPNPFQSCFTLSAPSMTNYRVINATGQLMETGQVQAGITTLGEQWPCGIYFLMVQSGQRTQTYKMVRLD